MLNNPKLKRLIGTFSELYWLKPIDIIWDAVTAYHVQKWIGQDDVLMDMGCGDGYFSALMLGAKLPLSHDRFINVISTDQKIKQDQSGDIYRNQFIAPGLEKKPRRKIDFGLELKPHHVRIAESLHIYKKIIAGRFESLDIKDGIVDKVYSVFAFYWGSDLGKQIMEVRRILRKHGEFIVTLPSEYLSGMHICKRLAGEERNKKVKLYFENLDGGRSSLTTRYARSEREWRVWFDKNGFKIIEVIPVVNKVMFVHQDISQRVFLPALFRLANSKNFEQFRVEVKKQVCEKLYPPLLNGLLKLESDPEVEHAYYLFRVKKT